MIGYVVGLLIGGLTIIVVSNNDMSMWLAVILAAATGITGALVMVMIEWIKEEWK